MSTLKRFGSLKPQAVKRSEPKSKIFKEFFGLVRLYSSVGSVK